MGRKLSRRLLFIAMVLCLVIPVAYIQSTGLARAQRPGGEGDGPSDGPFTPPTLELTGLGWLSESPPLPALTALLALDPVDCETMSPPIVGYEISRGQDPSEEVDFLNDLMAQGYSLGTVDLSTNAIPPCVDVLIVQGLAQNKHLSTAYSPSDGALLKNWTASGHGLMLNGDWGSFKTETQALFQAYDYRQLGDAAVQDGTDYDSNGPSPDPTIWVIYQPDNFASHPILAGVTSLQLQASSWLTPATNAIITTDADATPPTVPVMAFVTDNAGCAVLTTDSNWNATNNGNGGYAKRDNAKVARQMIEWLDDCATSAPADQPPTVNAGLNQTITLPAFATLDGTITDDRLSPLTTHWTMTSGPGTVIFGDASLVDTTASFSVAGVYVLRLTATDGTGSVFDEVSITANPTPASLILYLPLILHDFSQPISFPLFIGQAIPPRPIAFQGEIFYTTSVQIPGALPMSGKFYFSSEPDRISPVVVDDDLVILLNGSNRFTFHFSSAGQPVQPAIVEVPRATMEQLAGQTVTIEYRDIYAGIVYAGEVWLIWSP